MNSLHLIIHQLSEFSGQTNLSYINKCNQWMSPWSWTSFLWKTPEFTKFKIQHSAIKLSHIFTSMIHGNKIPHCALASNKLFNHASQSRLQGPPVALGVFPRGSSAVIRSKLRSIIFLYWTVTAESDPFRYLRVNWTKWILSTWLKGWLSSSKNSVSAIAKINVSSFTGVNLHTCQMKLWANGAWAL